MITLKGDEQDLVLYQAGECDHPGLAHLRAQAARHLIRSECRGVAHLGG
jgi:hypothetical protein